MQYEAEDAKAFASGRFWAWTAIGLGILAFGKGIREPNSWAYTQGQLDYSAGFMRRGLFGALLGRPLELGVYWHFAVVSTVLLLLLLGMLGLLAYKSGLAGRMPAGELLAVYSSSYSVTYLAHLNGYLDIPLAILCVAPLFIRSTGWRFAAALVFISVGILIHEQFFFAFLPVLVVSVLFGAATGKTARERHLALSAGIALALVGIVLTWYMGSHGAISPKEAGQLRQSIAARTDHPLNEELLGVIPRTAHENEDIMKSVWKRPTFWAGQAESTLLFGPTAALLSYATLLLLRQWRPGNHRWVYAGVLAVTLAPLSLHLVGWDKNRWNELLCLNAFLMLLTVSKLMGGEPVRLPMWMRRACLLVMLINMATGGGMLDGRRIRPFPFSRNPDATAGVSSGPNQ